MVEKAGKEGKGGGKRRRAEGQVVCKVSFLGTLEKKKVKTHRPDSSVKKRERGGRKENKR